MLTALLLIWVIADCSIKLYFSRQRRLDTIEHGQRLRSDLIRALTLEATQQCLDCKRLRGHDDDCALDMASLPPRSDAGQDVKAFGPFAVGDHFDRAVVDEKRRTISIDRVKGGLPWVGKLRLTVEAV